MVTFISSKLKEVFRYFVAMRNYEYRPILSVEAVADFHLLHRQNQDINASFSSIFVDFIEKEEAGGSFFLFRSKLMFHLI